MRRVRRGKKKSQSRVVKAEAELPIDDGSAQLAMIQALIPLGLRAVEEALITEVNNRPWTNSNRRQYELRLRAAK